LLALSLAVLLVATGYTVVRHLIDNSRYRSGHDAYQHADCADAIGHFDDVLSAGALFNSATQHTAQNQRRQNA
jgi:hypothetical protein